MQWDDQKTGDYPFATQFSWAANQISPQRWLVYNLIGGAVLGGVMGWLLFCLPAAVLSDPARMLAAVVLGIWTTQGVEKRAERTTKAAQAAMAATLGLCILAFALYLAILRP